MLIPDKPNNSNLNITYTHHSSFISYNIYKNILIKNIVKSTIWDKLRKFFILTINILYKIYNQYF